MQWVAQGTRHMAKHRALKSGWKVGRGPASSVCQVSEVLPRLSSAAVTQPLPRALIPWGVAAGTGQSGTGCIFLELLIKTQPLPFHFEG